MEDERVADLLKRAVSAVEDAEVPEDLRGAAFTAAFGALSGHAGAGGGGAGGGSAGDADGGGETSAATGSEMLDAIAAGLGLTGKQVIELYTIKDDVPRLSVAARKLPDAKAHGACDIALLVMAARQLAGVEEYTEGTTLREAAKSYGRFDQNNFASAIQEKLDRYVQTSGKGASAKRKLTQPGIEAAVELAQSYVAAGKEKA